MTILTKEIDPLHLLSDPPELTPALAASRWRELNILLHSVALLGDDLEDGGSLLPLLRSAGAVAGADRGQFYQWDEPADGLRVAVRLGAAGQPDDPTAPGSIQAQACLLHRKPVIVHQPEDPALRRELERLGARAAVSVPISHQGRPWGAIQLLRDRPFLREDAVLLWMLALVLEGVLPAILGPRRHREVVGSLDPATGLLRPDHFRRRLEWELRRSAWVARPVTVACIELLGTPTGQPGSLDLPYSIRESGRIVQKALGPHDAATCLGGAHFLLGLPDTDGPPARRLAEWIREALLERAAGTLPSASVAIGLATYPDAGRTEDEMIRWACSASRRPAALSRSLRVG